MIRSTCCIAPVSLLVAASMAGGQTPDSVSLPRVVVTSTRVPAPLGVGLLASTVIDRVAIEQSGARDVAELLRRVPGVSIARTGGPGAQTSMYVRGGENDYVRVLVDGVPVNDPGGAVDLGWLPIDGVERIELVRGPVSVLYGTDAVNGVVQIFTRRAADGRRAEVEIGNGRYNTLTSTASVAMGGPNAGLYLGAARDRTDGILELNNQFERTSGAATAHLTPRHGTQASLSLRNLADEYHFPTDGAGGLDDRNAFRRGRRLVASASITQTFAERWKGELTLAAFNSRGRDDDRADSPADTLGGYHYDAATMIRRRVVDGRLHFMMNRASVLTLGAEMTRETQRGDDSSNYSVARSHFSAERRTHAAFVQWLAEAGRVTTTVAGRLDENDGYGSFRTGRIGAAVQAWEGAVLRANLATAFKSPTFLETFNTAFSTGNPDLSPERSRSWEAGWSQQLAEGRLSIEATWFHQRFRDMIQYGYLSADLPNYFNVAAAVARGLEIEVRGRPASRVRLGVGGTFLRTRVEDEGLQTGESATFVRGARLLRRPSVILNGSLVYDFSGSAVLDVNLRRIGTRDDRDFSSFPATPVTLPSHTLLDVAFTGPLSATWTGASIQLTLRLENALGARYQEVMHYAAAGRSLFLGIKALAQ